MGEILLWLIAIGILKFVGSFVLLILCLILGLIVMGIQYLIDKFTNICVDYNDNIFFDFAEELADIMGIS